MSSPTLLADDRLDGVDLVRPRVLAETEEDHPPGVSHAANFTGLDPISAHAEKVSAAPRREPFRGSVLGF
jgi:hypothetical protein